MHHRNPRETGGRLGKSSDRFASEAETGHCRNATTLRKDHHGSPPRSGAASNNSPGVRGWRKYCYADSRAGRLLGHVHQNRAPIVSRNVEIEDWTHNSSIETRILKSSLVVTTFYLMIVHIGNGLRVSKDAEMPWGWSHRLSPQPVPLWNEESSLSHHEWKRVCRQHM